MNLAAFISDLLPVVAQVSKPAVSPIFKSADRPATQGTQVWKPAIQQTWKSAPLNQGAL